MKHFSLFLIAVASISPLLFSCSKDKKNIEKPEQKTFLLEKSAQTSGTNTYTNNYRYNSTGQVISESYVTTTSTSPNYEGTVEYDAAGKISKRILSGVYATTTYYYNTDGTIKRLVSTYPSGGSLSSKQYKYYADRVVTESYNASNAITITIVDYYNADKTGIALSRAYNAADVLQSETRFTYDNKMAIPGPFSSTQPFVNKRNVLSAETKDAAGKIISTHEYENVYAANGTKSKVTYTYKTYTNYPTVESTSVYIYDYTYRELIN